MMGRAAIVGAVFLLSAFLHAQVTAQQGEHEKLEVTHFVSPMVLNLPLSVADPLTWGAGDVMSDGLRRYDCAGVSVVYFSASASKPKKGVVKVRFRLMLMNEPTVDKRANVTLEIRRGDVLLAGPASEKRVKVEEARSSAMQTFTLLVPEHVLRVEPQPTVRVTIAVWPDP